MVNPYFNKQYANLQIKIIALFSLFSIGSWSAMESFQAIWEIDNMTVAYRPGEDNINGIFMCLLICFPHQHFCVLPPNHQSHLDMN